MLNSTQSQGSNLTIKIMEGHPSGQVNYILQKTMSLKRKMLKVGAFLSEVSRLEESSTFF